LFQTETNTAVIINTLPYPARSHNFRSGAVFETKTGNTESQISPNDNGADDVSE